jgi:hypothetical protein
MTQTMASPPPKIVRLKCLKCGLIAPAPIVLQLPTTRCANRQACARRVARLPKAKEPPSA